MVDQTFCDLPYADPGNAVVIVVREGSEHILNETIAVRDAHELDLDDPGVDDNESATTRVDRRLNCIVAPYIHTENRRGRSAPLRG